MSPLRFVHVAISEWLGAKITENQNAAFALLIWILVVFFIVQIAIIYFRREKKRVKEFSDG